jgi:hypothetical protein
MKPIDQKDTNDVSKTKDQTSIENLTQDKSKGEKLAAKISKLQSDIIAD